MVYACDHCHCLFSANKEQDRCPDCGKLGVRSATSKEIQEYARYFSYTELRCSAFDVAGKERMVIPGIKFKLNGKNGLVLTCESGEDGYADFGQLLPPGVYVVRIEDIPDGYFYTGGPETVELTRGETVSLVFSLTKKTSNR